MNGKNGCQREVAKMDTFVKEEILRELSTVHAQNPRAIDRISFLIRGDFPKYIETLKDELKAAHEENTRLQARVKQLERDALFHQIEIRRIANELYITSTKLKSGPPPLNRLQ